jgi:hypothetical protein
MAKQTLSILLISLMSIAPLYADVPRADPVIRAVNTHDTQSHDLPWLKRRTSTGVPCGVASARQ